MTISAEQLDTLQQIQALVMQAPALTGYTVYHDTLAWGHENSVWSSVRALDDDSNALLDTQVVIHGSDDSVPSYDSRRVERVTLEQQYSALTAFIASHRKQEEAA